MKHRTEFEAIARSQNMDLSFDDTAQRYVNNATRAAYWFFRCGTLTGRNCASTSQLVALDSVLTDAEAAFLRTLIGKPDGMAVASFSPARLVRLGLMQSVVDDLYRLLPNRVKLAFTPPAHWSAAKRADVLPIEPYDASPMPLSRSERQFYSVVQRNPGSTFELGPWGADIATRLESLGLIRNVGVGRWVPARSASTCS